jgi:hypothetical protein
VCHSQECKAIQESGKFVQLRRELAAAQVSERLSMRTADLRQHLVDAPIVLLRYGARAFALFVLSLASTSYSLAQDQAKRAVQAVSAEAQLRQQINGNTIGVLGGIMNGTFMRIVDDMAKVIDDGDDLRILPIVGKGGVQNLFDLLYLKDVDLRSSARNP